MQNSDVQNIIGLVRSVGDEILLPNWGKVSKIDKDDGSPVTVVDREASGAIIQGLHALTPDMPVISEEASVEDNQLALRAPMRWVTDPLDGTETYLDPSLIGKKPGFGVHLALIEGGSPIAGFIYFPAQERMYFTDEHNNAYVQLGNQAPEQIHVCQNLKNGEIRAGVPWKPERRPGSINGYDYVPVMAVGGEQICKVAHGEADIMWHSRPDQPGSAAQKEVFSHWDVAAPHAVLRAAGGDLYKMATGESVTYDNPDFTIPPFVAGHHDMLRRVGFHPIDRYFDSRMDCDL